VDRPAGQEVCGAGRALCGPGLNGSGRPAFPPLIIIRGIDVISMIINNYFLF